MSPLEIVLLSFAALIVLTLLLLFLGVAKLHVVFDGEVKVIASVLGIRFRIFPAKKDKKKKPLVECRNPKRALKKEQKLAAKQKKKAKKQQLKSDKKKKKKQAVKKKSNVVKTNLAEKIDMVLELLKELHSQTNGKLRIRVKALHISVGTDDAAKTAILYGVVLQSVSCLIGWIDTSFNRLKHKDGEMSVTADYISGKCHANVHIVCGVTLIRGLKIALHMLYVKDQQERIAQKKAKKRLAQTKAA